jgi:carboxypeptidase family protein/TonB-dependent receptor-like protein
MRLFPWHFRSDFQMTPSNLQIAPSSKLGNRFTAFAFAVLGLFALLSACGTVARAQLEAGQISGTVLDQSDAVVPGATISIRNADTNAVRTVVSSSTGAYLVPGLAPATYEVTVTAAAFKTYTAKVEVTVGGHVTLDAKLSVSATTSEVEVVGEGGSQVNTQTQEMSQVVDTDQIANLPSLTRNPYDFVALAGNVSGGDNSTNSGATAIDATGSGQNQTDRGVGYAINGQRQSGTEILLDGVENVSIFGAGIGEDIPLDGTQEFSVITSNYSAQYGRASGGVINVTTKQGTNSFHGSASEFNRLSAYTANTYANDAANSAFIDGGGTGPLPSPKGTYTRNQFGYAAGGPILKNKIFIFQSTEWIRVRSAANETEEIFDPAFIALMPANIQAYYKTYGQTALKSSGVASTVADVAATGITFGDVNGTTPIPATTPMFDTMNFSTPFDAGGGTPQNTYDLVGRVDFDATDKTQMFFRGGREPSIQLPGSDTYSAYPQYNTGTTYLNQSYLYSISHTFSPTVFLSAKASYTRFNENTSFDTSLVETPSLMFLSPTDPNTGIVLQMPGLQNSSEPGEGGVPVGGPQNTVQLEPDLSWTKGRHSMHFGFLGTYIQLDYAYGAYAQAVEQLGAAFQESLDDMMNTVGNPGGASLVSFQTRVDAQGKLPCPADTSTTDGNFGAATTGPSCAVQTPVSQANYARSYRYKDWSFYGEDSYKLTPRLTLDLGLRYEHYGDQHNNKPALDSNFYFGAGSGVEAQTRTGQVEIADQSPVHGFWATRWGTFAPRVGFAYDIFGDGHDSIRGGYGISYERNFGNVTYNASFNPPSSAVISDSCSGESFSCIANVTNEDLGPLGEPTGVSYLPPVELRHMDQNIQVAQTQFWSFALQHQIAQGAIIEIGYVGAKGDHLYDLANVNQQGAGQVYLGDPNVIGDACAGSGVYNINTFNTLTAANDPNASLDSSECLTRPNAQYTNVNMRGSGASSFYSGLNAKVQFQNLHQTGLSVVANYTWAHALDDLSSTFGDSLQGGSGYIGSLGYTSLAKPLLDWGNADYDVRQRLVVAPIWETPWFKQGSGIQREALGGWAISGIYTARGGIPFSAFDYSEDETFYTVPRLEPATPFYSESVKKKPQILGPNQFDGLDLPLPKNFTPLNSTLGISDFGPFPSDMMRRNSMRGPGAWNVDASLHKTFAITERVGLDFEADGIDVLNHHDYFANTTTLAYFGPSSPLFVQEEKGGLGTQATSGDHDERRFGQFGLKLSF